jgi:hypothetical protein
MYGIVLWDNEILFMGNPAEAELLEQVDRRNGTHPGGSR